MQRHAMEDGALVLFIPAQLIIPFEGGDEDGAAVTVGVVAGDGMTQGLHVDADLVGAAGVDAELHQGVKTQLFQYFVVGEGGLAFFVDYHDARLGGMLHDGQIDAALGRVGDALDNALVDLLYGPFLEYF